MIKQVSPLHFLSLLRWLDGQPLLDVMEPYRQTILTEALSAVRSDGAPLYRRVLTGRAKKNSKTTDAVLSGLYKLLAWHSAGRKGNQIYFVASDLGQAADDLDLCKKLIRCNPVLDREVLIKQNIIERLDGQGFLEILPAGDAQGLHGKTYLFLVVDELHTQKDYRLLEALELDRTRPDATQWFASYAAVSPTPGQPINDLLAQHAAQSDTRLYVSWYSGTVEEANPSLNGPLGPTLEDIQDAQRALPSWIFRRLYQNLPGQPDSAAFNAVAVQACVVPGRHVLPPQADLTYSAFCDLSGGGADDSTLCIGHSSEGTAIIDCLLDQGPRTIGKHFDPQQSVERFAAVLSTYGIHRVVGDRYAGEWPRQAFGKLNITYVVAQKTRSELYAALEPRVNAGQVELLDSQKMLAQLIGLVRKGERIDHSNGEHDDHSNAVAGLCQLFTVGAPLRLLNAGAPLTPQQQEQDDAEQDEARYQDGRHTVLDAIEHSGIFWP